MANGKELQTFEYDGKRITFDFGDGEQMINATQMAKAFNKRLDNFARLKQTKAFIEVLSSVPSDVREREIVRIVRGGVPELQGTWYCDVLALKLAAWLDPRFEVWVYQKIKTLLTEGQVRLTRDAISEKEFLFYLQKIADYTADASYFAEHLLHRKKGTFSLEEE